MQNSFSSKKKNIPWYIQLAVGAGVGFLVVVALGVYKYLEIKEAIAQGSKMGPPPEPVATTIVKKQLWNKELHTSGRLEATQGALIKAESNGRIDRIIFNDGEYVEKNTLLIVIDNQVEEAEYKAALARSELAEKTLTRQELLFKSKAISQEEYDTAKLTFSALQATSKSLKARLDKKEIRAPFSGYVGVRRVNVGQYVNEGDPLFQLSDNRNSDLYFYLGNKDSSRVEVGNLVYFTPSGTKTAYEGVVSALDPSYGLDNGTRLVKAKLKNSSTLPIAGTFGKVVISLSEKIDAFAVPSSGIQYAPYGNSIFIVKYKKDSDGNNSPFALPVFIKISDRKGDFVAVTDGLTDGDEVVTNGAFKLQKDTKLIINNSSKDNSSLSPTLPNS